MTKAKSTRALRYSSADAMPAGMQRLYRRSVAGEAARAPAPPAYRPAAVQAPAGVRSTGSTVRAKGRVRHVSGEMNKTESAYAAVLEARVRSGEIAWFGFECMTFKLAHDTRYTPDFIVQMPGGELELHEVKGRQKKGGKYYAEDDAKVKVKVAAAVLPLFAWKVVWPDGNGGWSEETVKC